MKQIKIFSAFFLLFAVLAFSSCRKDDGGTEQENITTVVLHFTSASGFDMEFESNDLDGDGGNPPVVDPIVLPANTVFDLHIHILDRSKNPVVEIDEEIKEEDEDHLFVFKTTGVNLTHNYGDQDANGKPVGLDNIVTTGSASSGKLVVTLFHEPTNKDDLNNPGGETDVEAEFSVTIQ